MLHPRRQLLQSHQSSRLHQQLGQAAYPMELGQDNPPKPDDYPKKLVEKQNTPILPGGRRTIFMKIEDISTKCLWKMMLHIGGPGMASLHATAFCVTQAGYSGNCNPVGDSPANPLDEERQIFLNL
jgi:hypothetical protein